MRNVEVPEVERPERFFPEPHVLSVPQVREVDDGTVEMRTRDRWQEIHPVYRDVVHRLEQGLAFDDLVATLGVYPEDRLVSERVHEKVARKFLWKLAKLGHVRFDLPEPSSFHDGRYRVLERLGRGGLGEAYLCQDRSRGNAPVVVKRPWGVKAKISSGQRALAREIRAYETLDDHPNVPVYHGSFQEQGLLHLVRDFVDGRSLRSWNKHVGREDVRARIAMARDVAMALHAFHERGVLFMDVSPGNFMVERGPHVVMADLGAVTPMEGGVADISGPRGTRGYRAPEVVNRFEEVERHATVRSEVYAFGCLFYRLVSGDRKNGSWWAADLKRALHTHEVPRRYHGFVLACCADRPRNRPRDMLEVVELLNDLEP